MSLKTKALKIAAFKALDTAGEAEIIVNVFGLVDSYKERTMPGCFAKSIKKKMPKGVWMHDWSRPVAKTLEAEELQPGDDRLPPEIKAYGGLLVKVAFNMKVQDGIDAYNHLDFGSVDEFSISYFEVTTKKAKDGILDLVELDLVEWSPVLLGACPNTTLLGIKAPQPGGAALRLKSEYLGAYAESSACMSAIYSLCDRLFWYCLYDCVYDDDTTVEERIGMASAGFDEFRDISVKIMRAIMSASDGAEKAADAADSIRLLTPNPDTTTTKAQRACASFESQVSTVLAAVKSCIERGGQISALRAKDGRSFSEARRAELQEVASSLEALVKQTQPLASEKERIALEAEILRTQQQKRMLAL